MSRVMSAAEVTKLLGASEKRSKFGVDNSENGKINRTVQDVVYASKFEASVAAELELKKRAKIITDWIRQVNVPLVINGVTVGRMQVDFKVFHKDGTTELIEAKGCGTPLWKFQRKVFEALNPTIKYTVRRKSE